MLPDWFVNRLFERLTHHYGSAWLNMWEGIDLNEVKLEWAEQLSYWGDHANAIGYVLTNLLPDKPPTVSQFKALCRQVPPPAFKALPLPKADPKVVAEAREKLLALKRQMTTPFEDRDQSALNRPRIDDRPSGKGFVR